MQVPVEPSGSADSGTIKSILSLIFSVNPSEVSKVVDKNDKPLVMYHGAIKDFSEFDKERLRERFPYAIGAEIIKGRKWLEHIITHTCVDMMILFMR
jgi:hypothetical protein